MQIFLIVCAWTACAGFAFSQIPARYMERSGGLANAAMCLAFAPFVFGAAIGSVLNRKPESTK